MRISDELKNLVKDSIGKFFDCTFKKVNGNFFKIKILLSKDINKKLHIIRYSIVIIF